MKSFKSSEIIKKDINRLNAENNKIVSEMLLLTHTRDTNNEYEKNLIEKVINDLFESREEISFTIEQLLRFIKEMQSQEEENNNIIEENIKFRNKINKVFF